MFMKDRCFSFCCLLEKRSISPRELSHHAR